MEKNYQINVIDNCIIIDVYQYNDSSGIEKTWATLGRFDLSTKEGYINFIHTKNFKQFNRWKNAIEKKLGEKIDWERKEE